MSTEAEVRRRWREWKWICWKCADAAKVTPGRLVHQGPYVDRCHDCGDETRYLMDPSEAKADGGEGLVARLTAERDALRDHVEVLECRNAEQVEITLDAGRQIAALTARVELLERLGDQMADELRSVAGDGEVCGLCHVYADHHKGNCAMAEAEAWRAARKP